MAITHKQLQELIDVTLKDLPVMPLEVLLLADCETDKETEIMIQFITEHYTSDEILKVFSDRLKWFKKFLDLGDKT